MKTARERAISFCETERNRIKAAQFPRYVRRIERMLNEHAAVALAEVESELWSAAQRYDDGRAEAIVVAGNVAVNAVRERLRCGT